MNVHKALVLVIEEAISEKRGCVFLKYFGNFSSTLWDKVVFRWPYIKL